VTMVSVSPKKKHRLAVCSRLFNGVVSALCLLLSMVSTTLVSTTLVSTVMAEEVTVKVPYVNLHTGPGIGFPVQNVILKGQQLEIKKLRADWFEVITPDGSKGWIPSQALQLLQDEDNPDGWVLSQRQGRHFYERQWEFGLGIGSMDSSALLSVLASNALTEHLSVETVLSQSLSDFSESNLLSVSLLHHLSPKAKWIPFAGVGYGLIHTAPSAVLVQPEDRTDRFFTMMVGVKRHVWRGFMFRMDYQHASVLTSRNENESLSAWKIGFGHFY